MQIEEVLQLLTDPIQRTLQMLRLEPAAYMFLFPKNLAEKIEIAVKNNEFPLFERLAPAIVYTIILGILRMILTFAVELLAIRVMQLGDYHKQEYDAEMDAIYLAVVNECQLKKKENVKRLKQINNKEEKDLAREDFNLELKKLEKNQINNYSKTRKLKSDLVLQYYQIKSNNVKRRKKVVKFVEALWRLIFYGVFCYVGYNALFVPKTAEWIVDTKKHWDGWPNHKISDVSWLEFYYLVELGSYFHQLLWTEVLLFMLSSITILRSHSLTHSFIQVTRSDATEMILHHLTTILLIIFSYLTNYTRVGASILLLHDSADIFLESAKLFTYMSKTKSFYSVIAKSMMDILFACFAIIFFVTRLVLYPRYILYSVIVEAPTFFDTNWIGYYVFASLLMILQLLHIFWFSTIATMIYKLVTSGIEKDERSDDDEDDDTDKKDR